MGKPLVIHMFSKVMTSITFSAVHSELNKFNKTGVQKLNSIHTVYATDLIFKSPWADSESLSEGSNSVLTTFFFFF